MDRSPLDFLRRNRRSATLTAALILAACLSALLLATGWLWARQQHPLEGIVVDPNVAGLLVTRIFPGSPAALAGLTRGTIIFAVDGLAVDDRATLEALLADRPGQRSGDAAHSAGRPAPIPDPARWRQTHRGWA